MGGGVAAERLNGWRAERAQDGSWVAAKLVWLDWGGTVTKVRRRRRLDVPSCWRKNEVEAHMALLARTGALD